MTNTKLKSVPVATDRGIILCIDPGHGGADEGASANGVVEKIKVLQLAMAAKHTLSSSDPRCRTYLTRDTDWHPQFSARAQTAKTLKADLVISVHINAATDPNAHGLWLFHKHGCNTSKSLCTSLAQSPPSYFQSTPVRIFDAYDDPKKDNDTWLNRPEHVLERYPMPAILIEYGFCTNPVDAAYLTGRNCLGDFGALVGAAVAAFRRG